MKLIKCLKNFCPILVVENVNEKNRKSEYRNLKSGTISKSECSKFKTIDLITKSEVLVI
jgi:hypothetical protein